MSICEEVQARLADDGIAAVQAEPRLAQHLASCPDCTAIAAALSAVDAALAELPERDAPDSAVAATLKAVAEQPAPPRHGALGRRQLAGALAATLVVAAVFGIGQHLLQTSSYQVIAELDRAGRRTPAANEPTSGRVAGSEGKVDRLAGDDAKAERRETFAANRLGAGEYTPERLLPMSRAIAPTEPGLEREAELVARLQQLADLTDTRDKAAAVATGPVGGRKFEAPGSEAESSGSARQRGDAGAAPTGPMSAPSTPSADREQSKEEAAKIALERAPKRIQPLANLQMSRENLVPERHPAEQAQMAAGPELREHLKRSMAFGSTVASDLDEGGAETRAKAFLARISSTENLTFQQPTGYWANTYVPGDPAMRLVRARLDDWDRRQSGRIKALDREAQQAVQPFDRPTDAALALYLDADTASIQGETRLRLQVGLKGADRLGGHRPTMNVALVLDPRDLERGDAGQRFRALANALARAHQPGDRFSLILADPHTRVAVAADDFRHGPLQVALAALKQVPEADLSEALALAADTVAGGEDAVLGSSLVLLATASDLGAELPALEDIAHRSAVGGVPLSVVNLGGAQPGQVDRLVAAGQGNRRNLNGAAAAEALVDAELHAASRVVARAVRLRIRLAPGVKLVDVLGSRRLEAPQAQRVRQAEQAIDRRAARNLGIASDRGEDEEGIQIVIPNFYAGDAHVILLDVVADRPGPVADVTARYKDVVRLRNGSAQAQLSLPGGEREAGPLERNVLKNLLAYEVARRARRIGLELEQSPAPALLPEIAALRELVHGLRREVPGWVSDADLAADEQVLAGYFQALQSPLAAEPAQRRMLGDSLRYVAFAKLHTRRD